MAKLPAVCATAITIASVAITSSAQPLDNRPVVDDVFYHFMPIAWRDSDGDVYRYGDFNGMTASLDYLEDLGVTAVWMNPVFVSPAYHGYQHGAGDEINPRFGTEAEFLNFVDQAHARGIKVFIDFVVYGISHDTLWFQNAYGNPSSTYDNWFAFTNFQNTQFDLGATYSTWNGDPVGFIHWNLDDPGCTDLITQWSQYWLDPDGDGDPADGIDGYRLDHVSAHHPQESVWGYDINWWVQWKADLQDVNPDVFTFAEQADWGYNGIDLLPAHDATMTKPFEFAARDAIAGESAGPLYSAMAALVNEVPPGRTMMAIVGDHDVDRLTSVIGGSLQKAGVGAAILMTQPFTPIIYHGDEIGMLGTKQNYGGDANDIPMREPFKWNAVAGPPMSNYWVRNRSAYLNAFSHDNDGRSVEEQSGVPGSLLEEYRLLIATRKDNLALRRGSYHPVPASNPGVWSFLRYAEGQQTLLVAINLRGFTVTTNLDLTDVTIPGGATGVQDIITGQSFPPLTDSNKSAYSIAIPGYHYRILSINADPVVPETGGIDGAEIPSDLGANWLAATQNTPTNLGDNISELNQLFVRPGPGGLTVGATGNLATDATALVLLIDAVDGGQNILDTGDFSPPPSALEDLDGLRLEPGFAADNLYYINTWSGNIYVDEVRLETGNSTKIYRGRGTLNDGDGFLTGGSNPNGLLVAINNTNVLGVTSTSAATAATATTGAEMFLPFADLGVTGHPKGTARVTALLVRSNGVVSNQVLPGVGGSMSDLGVAPDLRTVIGQQYAIVSLDVPGDGDGDGLVTVDDFDSFLACQTAPDGAAGGSTCALLDFEGDTDVDLADFSEYQTLVRQ